MQGSCHDFGAEAFTATDQETIRQLELRWGITAPLAARALALYRFAAQRGVRLRVTSGYRSPQAQARLFSSLPPGEALPPSRSLHTRRRALDFGGTDAALDWLEDEAPWRRFGLRGIVHQGTKRHLHVEL